MRLLAECALQSHLHPLNCDFCFSVGLRYEDLCELFCLSTSISLGHESMLTTLHFMYHNAWPF